MAQTATAKLKKEIGKLAAVLGSDVDVEGKTADELEQIAAGLRAGVEAKDKADGEAAEKKKKKPPYYLAPRCSILSRRGFRNEGEEIKAADLAVEGHTDGKEELAAFVKSGRVLKGQ